MSELFMSANGAQNLLPIQGNLLNNIPRVGNDIKRVYLKGDVASGQQTNSNFVECKLDACRFIDISLNRVDWKDCRVTGSIFENCDLGYASFITNHFEDCRFINCRFEDTSISDSTFKNCEFKDCDLSHIIIKSSSIEESIFDTCITSNRVIESSLLIDTKWLSMEIDVRLIMGNFGLLQSHCEQCTLVTRDAEGVARPRPWSELENIFPPEELGPIEYLRLSYFNTEDLEADTDALEAALDLRNWGSDAVVQASLASQLSSFAHFLLTLFARNRLPIYPILLLHSRNFEVLNWLGNRGDAVNLYQVSAGVHWLLTREVDVFFLLVETLKEKFVDRKTIHFAANGPVDVGYFQEWLLHENILGVCVESVRPRNSPVDLGLSFENAAVLASLLALFLATRTSVEISKLPLSNNPDSIESHSSMGNSLFAISAGLLSGSEQTTEYELSVRTLLPRSLLLDFRLTMNVSVFKKARRVLVHIVSPKEDISEVQDNHQLKSVPRSSHSPEK